MEAEKVHYRTTNEIAVKKGTLKVVSRSGQKPHKLKIKSKDELIEIHFTNIQHFEKKEFHEELDEFPHVLSVDHKNIRKNAVERISFYFHKQETRDRWIHEMENFMPEQKEQQPGKGQFITKIELMAPSNRAMAVSMALKINNQRNAIVVDIPENSSTPDAVRDSVKEKVKDVTHSHCLSPEDSKSLYRYVRSVTHRISMETEANAIVSRIGSMQLGSQQLDAFCTQRLGKDSKGITYVDRYNEAAHELDQLLKNIESRFGGQGPSAAILARILERNVCKMKMINELQVRIRMDTGSLAEVTRATR